MAPIRSRSPLDVRLYRAALYLYPPRFRREFAAQMAMDFEEARAESRGARARLWWQHGVDVAGSLVIQWLRTGWPVVIAMAITWPIVILSAIARYWRPMFFQLPPRSHDGDVLTLVMLVTVVLFIVIATVVFTLCFAIRPIRRPRARRR